MSESEDKTEENDHRPTLTFIDEWCKLYGLDAETADYLRHHGYTTGDDILTLYIDDIKRFTDLDDVRKWLLPSAVTRYRQGREVADKQLQQKGVVLTKKPKAEVKKRDMGSLWRFHASKLVNTNKVALTLMSPEKREAYLALRKRLQAPTLEQLSEKVDQLLASLLETEEPETESVDPDAPDVDLADSQRKTEEALLKLETELFTEEELKLVARVNSLREKYNNVECPEYEQELSDIIDSM